MSVDRCTDIKIDWNIPDTIGGNQHHYDARVLRNCRPGASLFSDPTDSNRPIWSGEPSPRNRWWDEPADWDGPNATRVREVVAYMIDDDSPLPVLLSPASVEPDWMYKESGDNTVWGGGPNAPRTDTSWYARVYTLYEDNHVDWSENEARPFTCPNAPGDC